MANAKALVDYGYRVILIGERKGLAEGTILEEYYDGIHAYLMPTSRTMKDWIKELLSITLFKKIIEDFYK
jgi:hypothetical protein